MRRLYGRRGMVSAAVTAGLAGALSTALADEAQWRVLPIRSEAEFEAGMIGGEAEQHPQGIARAASDPDIIYLSHDVGLVWRSDDNGRTWDYLPGEGMYSKMGQSIEVDPVDADVVLAVMDEAYDYFSADYTGLYRTTDGGETWDLVLHTDTEHQRNHQENIAYAPSRVTDDGAQLWYAGFPGNALYASTDGGRNWDRRVDLDDHEELYAVTVHPDDGDRVYLASSRGLFVSRDGGETIERVEAGLSDTGVGSVRIDANDPDRMHVAAMGEGLYVSHDGGASFDQQRAFNAHYVFVHEAGDVIYLVGQRGEHTLVSHDAGETWHEPEMQPAPGLGRDEGVWKFSFDGGHSAILPDPRDADAAVGYSRATIWRTEDGGRAFEDSSTLWTGYAWGWFTSAVSFDRFDPDRFAFFLYDVGMVITENGGQWFTRGSIPWAWRRDGEVAHSGMYAGDLEPVPGSEAVVAAGGLYWNNRLMRSDNEGETWQLVDDGNGTSHLYIAFHPDDPDIVYAHDTRSHDGGHTFEPIEPLQQRDAYIIGVAESRPDTLYAYQDTGEAVLRSDDRGATWHEYVRVDWPLAPFDSKPTIIVDPTDEDRIYALDAQGDLAVYDGETWQSLDVLDHAGSQGGRNFVRAVAVDPNDPDILYAGTHAPGRPFIFRSTNRGESWQDITGNLGRKGIGGLVVHPHTGDVFIGGIAGTRVLGPPYESDNTIYDRLPDDWRDHAFPDH